MRKEVCFAVGCVLQTVKEEGVASRMQRCASCWTLLSTRRENRGGGRTAESMQLHLCCLPTVEFLIILLFFGYFIIVHNFINPTVSVLPCDCCSELFSAGAVHCLLRHAVSTVC